MRAAPSVLIEVEQPFQTAYVIYPNSIILAELSGGRCETRCIQLSSRSAKFHTAIHLHSQYTAHKIALKIGKIHLGPSTKQPPATSIRSSRLTRL